MLSVVVRLRVRPGRRTDFLEAIRRNAAASLREPGCHRFDVTTSSSDPDAVLLYEVYDDQGAFEAHLASDHFAQWRSVRDDLVVEGSQVTEHFELDAGRGYDGVRADSRDALFVRRADVEAFDRGGGVSTLPYLGHWNSDATTVTTGTTTFLPRRGLPLHTHNVEESVLVLEGRAHVVVDDRDLELGPGDATWVPTGVPHRVVNDSDQELTIYWVYGGRDVTRTIVASGLTVAHLSDDDRGGAPLDH